MRDGDITRVDDGRERDVLGIQTRFEDRAEAWIVPQRTVGIAADGHDLACAVVDGLRQELGARAALLHADPREPRDGDQAQCHDDRADDRGDAEDLLAFNA